MPVTVLGVSAHYHDSSAAIVRDGEVVAACEEERFTRRKHEHCFPAQAINACLERAWVEPSELDAAVVHDDPLLTLDRVLHNVAGAGTSGRERWERAAPALLGVKLGVADHIRQYLNVKLPVMHANHHQSHAASAFYPSPFEQAAILTVDGVGEWATTCIGAGRGPAIELTAEIRWPHSIGLLYSAFTSYCGFEPNSDEYKLMGLAGYGNPVYAQVIRERVVAALPDGAFRVAGDMFGWSDGGAATSPRLDQLLGPPRQSCEELTERYADVAASVQAVVEELIVALASEACRRAKSRNLVMAGGVALNCLANARVLESVVDQLWAQPAAGDAGGSLGAALLASHKAFGVQRRPASPDGQGGSLLGPAWSTDEVRAFLTWQGAPHELVPDQATLVERVAAALEDGKVVGWFQGPMEFGPRALGGRSILADARRPEARELLNKVVKRREPFRPFAPSVLAERAAELFEISAPSPYMLLTANVRKGAGLPATTHVDGTARVQTVDATTNPRFRALIEAFYARTGCPAILNTSFNVAGEPIVASPIDAYRCFISAPMDVLVLEDCVLSRSDQPPTTR